MTADAHMGRSRHVSMAEVNGMVSLALGLPVHDEAAMRFAGELHGTINHNLSLRDQAARGGGLNTFILSNAPPDIIARLDPARRAEAERRRALHTANKTGSDYAAAHSQGGGLGGRAPGRDIRAGSGDGGGSGGSSGSSGTSGSGARYDAFQGASAAAARGYALGHGMAWATKEPELLKMGAPAIKALHDAGLKGDGYGILHKPEHMHFDNPTIVSGADFMKRHHLNYNDAARAAGAVYNHKSMTPGEQGAWQGAVGGVLRSKPGASDEAARGKLHDTGTAIKQAHPEMTPHVDRALQRFNAAKGNAHNKDAKATAAAGQQQSDQAAAKAGSDGAFAALDAAPKAKPAPAGPKH